jgi:acetyl esterase/lipase
MSIAVTAAIVSATFARADEVNVTPDVVYGHKFGMALTFDVYTPQSEPNGAGVLFMVSGGWYSRWSAPNPKSSLFEPLLEEGFTVFAVRHGSSPKFSIPEAVEDVRRSVRFIRSNADRFGIDPERLGVYGASAGGHLSLMLGTASDEGDPDAKDPVLRVSDRVQAVVAWVAPTDLTIMVWEHPEHLPAYDRFPALELGLAAAGQHSPLMHVTPDDAPTLLVVGAKDELVPMSHSQNIATAFKQQEVATKLVILEEAGHGFAGPDRNRAMNELVDWFQTHLNGSTVSEE